jgi:hypothetical protein
MHLLLWHSLFCDNLIALRGVTRDGDIDGLIFPLLEGSELRQDLTVKFFFLSSSSMLS